MSFSLHPKSTEEELQILFFFPKALVLALRNTRIYGITFD